MCFCIRNTVESRTLWVAKEDITCYKVLEVKGKKKRSPYRYFEYVLNKVYKSKLEIAPINKYGFYIWKSRRGYEEVSSVKNIDQGIHTYSERSSVMHFPFGVPEDPSWTERVFECHIPKGSEFYYDPRLKEYVSNQLVIKRQIKYKLLD